MDVDVDPSDHKHSTFKPSGTTSRWVSPSGSIAKDQGTLSRILWRRLSQGLGGPTLTPGEAREDINQ